MWTLLACTGDPPPGPAAAPATDDLAAWLAAVSDVVATKGHAPIWDAQVAGWVRERGIGTDPWGNPPICAVDDAGTSTVCRSTGPDGAAFTEDDRVGTPIPVGVASPTAIGSETAAACVDHDEEACVILAMQATSPQQYRPILLASCARGHGEACWLLPSWLERDHAAPEAELVLLLDRACKAGQGVACQSLSRHLTDPAAKKAALDRGCALGHHWSCEVAGQSSSAPAAPRP
jgi:hypothetical protein